MAEISRWSFTQCVREVVCPRCGVPPGDPCRTPRRRRKDTPHAERHGYYIEKIGAAEFKRRHSFKPRHL